MIKEVDVVVVGAGNAGLTAAATTASMGLSTLLVERHNIPGGAALSSNLRCMRWPTMVLPGTPAMFSRSSKSRRRDTNPD